MHRDFLTTALGIQGFRVAKADLVPGPPGQSILRIELERTSAGHICSGCGQGLLSGYDHTIQEVQHLPVWQHRTFLSFERWRVNCPECGIRTEELSLVAVRGPRVTRQLAAFVHELLKVTTVQAASALLGLHRHTLKAIDSAELSRIQAQRSFDGVSVMGVDEIGVGKGQNYWMLVSALEGPRGPEMLHIVEGHSKKKLKRFWRWFGKRRSAALTHAVVDMAAFLTESIREHAPQARLIYDKFHVVRLLNVALNEVRKMEIRRALGRFKQTLSGKKFILLARRSRVRGKAREALDTLLAASPKLYKAHLLKESFGKMWDYRTEQGMLRFWQDWKATLKWARMKPYQRFARTMDERLHGILAFCDKKVPLGYIESCNLKARNVIRRAYGYRDKEYMKLKVIQACTPWMAQFRPWTLAHSSVP